MFNNIRLIATTSTAAALALFVAGVIQVTDTPSGETTVVGIEHVLLGCLSAALVLLIPVVLHLGPIAGRRETGAVTAVGQGVLALLVLISNGRGSVDLPAVAGLSNLAIFGGLIVLAIALGASSSFARARRRAATDLGCNLPALKVRRADPRSCLLRDSGLPARVRLDRQDRRTGGLRS